jgi:hypothetical protein
MPDGSVVKDFKVSKDAAVATLVTYSGAYELRPYWDVRMFLDEMAPGGVFGITAFIWANTGDVISYSNMATGGTVYPDSYNPTGSELISSNYALMAVMTTVIVVVAVLAVGLAVTKKRK